MNYAKKKKKNLIALFLIISLIAIGGVIFFFAHSQNKSKANKSEAEKYLLEKRLELKKYFVFNLGEEVQPGSNFTSDGQTINNPFVRRLNSSLATDLTKLLGVKKDLIIFAGTNKNTPNSEWTADKLDNQIQGGASTYILFDKTKIKDITCSFFRKDTRFPNAFTLAVLAEPEVKILSGKEKSLDFLKKNDPFFTGRSDHPVPPPPPPFFPPVPLFDTKKLLAEQIKEDLEKDLARIKKSNGNENSMLRYTFSESANSIICEKEHVWVNGERRERQIGPSELEKEDWDEIIGLIKQLVKLWKQKKAEWKQKESEMDEETKRKKFMLMSRSLTSGSQAGCRFWNPEQKRGFWVPFEHPSLKEIELKVGSIYLVEGIKQPLEVSTGWYSNANKIDMADKITITLL